MSNFDIAVIQLGQYILSYLIPVVIVTLVYET